MSLTVSEAAKRLGITPGTARLWIATGRLNGHKRGNTWAVAEDSVSRLECQLEPARCETCLGDFERFPSPTKSRIYCWDCMTARRREQWKQSRYPNRRHSGNGH